MMEPWYKVTVPRAEVREGRSFNPDEFAIALEQVVAGTAPEDYRDAKKFFDRTCFTRALTEHVGLVLRRLAGQTQNAAPVLSLITQFGGGKTHTLTALYHLVHNAKASSSNPEVQTLLREIGLSEVPSAKVAVFVGNAWDPAEGKETPWIDMARQLAGTAGIEALGAQARMSAPGTDALSRVFELAGGRALLLFDEVLNFFNRHRGMSEQFYAFLQNLTVAITGTSGCAAMISLPRSLVEMTDLDQQWLDRISKVVRRVAKDLIANDESEISEVVRRRLFEDLGKDSVRKSVAKAYADWCFERRAQLPPEWTAVDAATTDAKARDYLRARFESSYPFHPATISVFQRKWQGLMHYQRTRGTLAMFAQWISWAAREAFSKARKEPLITLGSAPLDVPEFRAAILGQLGDDRLFNAIDVDIAGPTSHARALDADTKGPLKDIHRRVGAAILFESTGVATDKPALFPDLRFALGEPDLDTTSVDTAATTMEKKSFFIRRVGTDGFRIGSKPTMRKIVGDRRAALDEAEIMKAIRDAVRQEFDNDRIVPVQPLVRDGGDVADSPKLTLVVLDPEMEWDADREIRKQLGEWTRVKGKSPRFYPGALVWVARKSGKALREKAELLLAWVRVSKDLASGTLGADFEESERRDVASHIKEAGEVLHDEVWASYRYALIADSQGVEGLREIDLGAGHSSASGSLSTRVVAALKAEGLLNESVGAGYIERNWPPALKESGNWPLKGLRQAFLDGTLTRLLDPEEVLRRQIASFVAKGEFGLGSDLKPDGNYKRMWWKEAVGTEEVTFDDKTYLLTRKQATAQKAPSKETAATVAPSPPPAAQEGFQLQPPLGQPLEVPANQTVRLALRGKIPPEQWNKLGTKLLPKLRGAGQDLSLGLDATLTVREEDLRHVEEELKQALKDLGLDSLLRIEKT